MVLYLTYVTKPCAVFYVTEVHFVALISFLFPVFQIIAQACNSKSVAEIP